MNMQTPSPKEAGNAFLGTDPANQAKNLSEALDAALKLAAEHGADAGGSFASDIFVALAAASAGDFSPENMQIIQGYNKAEFAYVDHNQKLEVTYLDDQHEIAQAAVESPNAVAEVRVDLMNDATQVHRLTDDGFAHEIAIESFSLVPFTKVVGGARVQCFAEATGIDIATGKQIAIAFEGGENDKNFLKQNLNRLPEGAEIRISIGEAAARIHKDSEHSDGFTLYPTDVAISKLDNWPDHARSVQSSMTPITKFKVDTNSVGSWFHDGKVLTRQAATEFRALNRYFAANDKAQPESTMLNYRRKTVIHNCLPQAITTVVNINHPKLEQAMTMPAAAAKSLRSELADRTSR